MYKTLTRPLCLLVYITMLACKLKMLSTEEYLRRNPASLITLFLVAQFVSLELSIFQFILFRLVQTDVELEFFGSFGSPFLNTGVMMLSH